NLLSGNVGLFDVDRICDLVELTDQLGMDSISLGGSLAYACEYNRRHPDRPIAEGLSYGDADALEEAITAIGNGQLGLLGQGTKRLSEELGETGYAMHCKGVEFPAYLPQTNPGYPFALAGGHMSMQTYLLLLYERETGLDYWVEAITKRGPAIMRDDLIGICKFSGMPSKRVAEAIEALTGLKITGRELSDAVRRTYLRGYRIERRQGFLADDYDLPAEVHREYGEIDLPHFLTAEFFAELKTRVLARFDAMLAEAAL
ncbi:MAG: aldehyde ferredoxin oxidoreductase C-terminal domain-containing protein, partial [Planctomycetota bacterium]